MTTVQRVAQVFGWIFLAVGIIGFFYSHTMEMQMLLGIFPVNFLHNTVHIVFGILGLLAAQSFGMAKTYAQIVGVIYILLALMGAVDPTGLGLVPLGGNDIWLHAVLGIVLVFFGFTAKGETATPTVA